MDLKEFIVQTISGIVDATSELQRNYEAQGVIINPPVSSNNKDLFLQDSGSYLHRKIEMVEFDVAVTATSETSAGGKAALKILAMEAGGEGKYARRGEEVSRVKFSIPLVLAPSDAETKNREVSEKARKRTIDDMGQHGSDGDWMSR